MPGYKGHLLGGAFVGGTMLVVIAGAGLYSGEYPMLAALFALVLLGALFPDIDTNSKGQTLFYSLLLLLDGWLIYRKMYIYAAWVGLLALIPVAGRHRGWVHSWWAMLVLPSPILGVPLLFMDTPWEQSLPFYLAFVLGYFSHLLLDRTLF